MILQVKVGFFVGKASHLGDLAANLLLDFFQRVVKNKSPKLTQYHLTNDSGFVWWFTVYAMHFKKIPYDK